MWVRLAYPYDFIIVHPEGHVASVWGGKFELRPQWWSPEQQCLCVEPYYLHGLWRVPEVLLTAFRNDRVCGQDTVKYRDGNPYNVHIDNLYWSDTLSDYGKNSNYYSDALVYFTRLLRNEGFSAKRISSITRIKERTITPWIRGVGRKEAGFPNALGKKR